MIWIICKKEISETTWLSWKKWNIFFRDAFEYIQCTSLRQQNKTPWGKRRVKTGRRDASMSGMSTSCSAAWICTCGTREFRGRSCKMGGVAAMLRGRAVKNRGVLFNCHNFAKKIFQRIKVALLLSPLWASNGMKPGLKALESLEFWMVWRESMPWLWRTVGGHNWVGPTSRRASWGKVGGWFTCNLGRRTLHRWVNRIKREHLPS